MPRTPSPSDTVLRNYRLKEVNEAFVQGIVEQTGRPLTEVLHGEIVFARVWGLPSHLARRLDVEAATRGLIARDVVRDLARTAAGRVPRAVRIVPEPPSALGKRSTLLVTAANDAFIQLLSKSQGYADPGEALNAIVEFNRRFDLPADLFTSFTQHAESKGASLRDLVVETLFFEAMRLPEAPPLAGARKVKRNI